MFGCRMISREPRRSRGNAEGIVETG